jgi:4-hydroxy-3-polyprenylbenzoate decarboxylase
MTRAACVCLKEKKPLIISPRESPLSAIALQNLLSLSQNGVIIMPPVPSFYDKKEDFKLMVDSIVGRILDKLGFDNNLYRQWGQ